LPRHPATPPSRLLCHPASPLHTSASCITTALECHPVALQHRRPPLQHQRDMPSAAMRPLGDKSNCWADSYSLEHAWNRQSLRWVPTSGPTTKVYLFYFFVDFVGCSIWIGAVCLLCGLSAMFD
jgi:hypothetical protein